MRIPQFDRRSPLQREWDSLCKKENSLRERKQKKKESALNQMLEEKVPPKLQETLDLAFEKAFALVFEKGTGMIEKTCRKETREKEFQLNQCADEIYRSRKSLHAFSKRATQANAVNLALSGVSGIGLGLLGIGIPDIPVFTGMLLKSVYETAMSYGIDYNKDYERYFILIVIEGAVSYGAHFKQVDDAVEAYIEDLALPADYQSAEQIARTSRALSNELLYMKFLQGIPVVGAVGGAYDALFMKAVSEYATLKYKKRFLLSRQSEE